MKDVLSLDFETFSELNLPSVGSSMYSRHKSTRPLMLGWMLGDYEAEVVRFEEGQRAPKILKEALRDPEVIKMAWNAAFEIDILTNTMGVKVDPRQWRCTMVHAYTLSFPGKLELVGPLLGLPEDKLKMKEGKDLIKKFCGYRKPTKKDPRIVSRWDEDPDEWELFVDYCRRDVESERALYEKMKRWEPPEHEWELWALDRKINQKGIPIHMPVVENAIKITTAVIETRLAEMKEITGLKNPNSNAQLLPWLRDNGYIYNDLKAGHVRKAFKQVGTSIVTGTPFEEVRDLYRILELRQEVSKSSVKKYKALKLATDDDGFLRNAFQFAGAQRTWRWAGRKFQAQNLPRPTKFFESVEMQAIAVRHLERLDHESIELLYAKPMDLLASCIRPVVQATAGSLFCDADLNAIENRVLGWIAKDEKILDVFRKGRDPYIDFATYMYKEPYEQLFAEYKAGNKTKRTVAKPGVLGCGYLLGAGQVEEDPKTGEETATGLLGYAWNMGVMLTPEQSALAVKTFRAVYEGVTQFWKDIERAAVRCINTKEPQRVGFIKFDMSGPFMRMKLPSGRNLHYFKPRVEQRRKPWGDVKDTITYMGLNAKGHWGRLTTHPGKLTENADQAIARDLLAHGMLLADARGLDIRLHVHDQAVNMAPADKAHEALKTLIECLETVPDWAPGLILAAEGEVSHAFFKT